MARALTAARIELFLLGGSENENMQVGLAQRIEISDRYNNVPLKGIGYHYTLGYEPGIYEGSGSLSVVRLSDVSLQQMGIREHRHLVSDLNAAGMELVIRDKRGVIIDQLTEVHFDDVRTTVDVGTQLVMEDISIVFTRIIDTLD